MLLLAAHDPVDHVLPHPLFRLLPFNFNFGESQIPLLGFSLGDKSLYFTNHLLMTLVAALLCLLIFPRLARAYAGGGREPSAPRGAVTFFELLLQFVREEVARPVLKQRTDAFVPFLWTLFFFILFCNVLGMVPLADIIRLISGGRLLHLGGTATGNLAVTGGLAICAFLMIHVSGVRETYQALLAGGHGHHDQVAHATHEAPHGPSDSTSTDGHGRLALARARLLALPTYIWNLGPHVFARPGGRPRLNLLVRAVMIILYSGLLGPQTMTIFALLAGPAARTAGLVVGVALGLVAGIMARGLHWTDIIDVPMWGFLWLLEVIGAVIKPFALMIRLFANMIAGHIVLASILLLIPAAGSYLTGVTSAAGCVALSFLELFVAVLQAYIFVFLTTLFISMAVEPQH